MKNSIFTITLFFGIFSILLFISSCKRPDKFSEGNPFELEDEETAAEVALKVQAYLDSLPNQDHFNEAHNGTDLNKEFNRFYNGVDYYLAWVTPTIMKEQGNEYIETLQNEAAKEGLNPEEYYLSEILSLKAKAFSTKQPDLPTLIKLDTRMTASYLKYASHLATGTIDPTQVNNWHTKSHTPELAYYLFRSIKEDQVKTYLDSLLPHHPLYRNLKKGLGNLTEVQKKGGWPTIPSMQLKQGDSSAVTLLLKSRLGLPVDSSRIFDERVEYELKRFQERSGLPSNGKLDNATIEALNTPIEKQIALVKLNLDRLRWLPEKEGERFLLVNIPETRLRIFNGGKKEMEMDVIVGKTVTPTPIFSDTMEHLILSPTWGVPYSIAAKEMLDDIQRNPGYLTHGNYALYKNGKAVDPASVDWNSVSATSFNYQIVQRPGTNNALGTVKFMFPNRFNVYLHDTNQQYLFSREKRYFSHGCIRVAEPGDMAEYLLKPTGQWDRDRIEEGRNSKITKQVSLPEKLPVHVYYLTALADEKGDVSYHSDIYGFDRKHMDLMKGLKIAVEKEEVIAAY